MSIVNNNVINIPDTQYVPEETLESEMIKFIILNRVRNISRK